MARGDAFKQISDPITETRKPTVIIPTALPIAECCYIPPLFGNLDYADPAKFDELKQDTNSYFNYYGGDITDVEIVIQKCGASGEFETIIVVSDNTYGTYRAFGDEIINDLKFVSFENINWSKILVEFEQGIYRVRTNEVSGYASTPLAHDNSISYDLQEFDPVKADGTVVFKVVNTGSLGDVNDPTKRFNFPSGNWENGIRLPGSFGYDTSAYTTETTKYRDGSKKRTKTKREDRTMFKGDKPLAENIRKYFKNELMMADRVFVTDYNKNAANTHHETPVHGDGEFSPVYEANSSHADFDVEFTSAFNNNDKKHC